jgi:ketosteroid isomerase-like protein
MSEQSNKQLVLEYVDAFNRADIPALSALFAADAFVYGVLGGGGLDQVVPIWRELHEAFAPRLEVESMAAEGDTVAVRYRERGPFRGHAPTGRSFELFAMEWFVMKDGKIYRRWGVRDSASQSRQMGLPLN